MAWKYFCRPGKHFYYGALEFWAQGGMCHVFDHRDNSCLSISPREYLKRAIQIGKVIKLERLGDERNAKINLCNQMEKVSETALFQGDPTDREVMAWKLRQRGLAWVLNSVSVPPPVPGLGHIPDVVLGDRKPGPVGSDSAMLRHFGRPVRRPGS